MTPSTSTYLLLGILRTVYFLGCRRYVHRSLLSDIRQVIHDDRDAHQAPNTTVRGELGQSAQSGLRPPVLDDEDEDSGFDTPTPLASAQGTGAGPSSYPWMASGKAAEAIPMRNRAPSGGASPKEGDASSSGHPARARGGKRRRWGSSAGYSRGASLVFCWAFCEGSLLFSLVLLGGVLEPTCVALGSSAQSAVLTKKQSEEEKLDAEPRSDARPNRLHRATGRMPPAVPHPLPNRCAISRVLYEPRLTALLPATERPKLLGTRMLVLTLVPFTLYLFAFYRIGSMLQSFLGIETGSHHFGASSS